MKYIRHKDIFITISQLQDLADGVEAPADGLAIDKGADFVSIGPANEPNLWGNYGPGTDFELLAELPDEPDEPEPLDGVKVEIHTINLPPLPEWNVEELTGYKPFTTFWQDFSIADVYGPEAVKDTYTRAFNEWKSQYKYLTELVMVLNWKSWQHSEKRQELAELYADLYYKADAYALDNLKGDEQQYYLQVTD